jgi:putative cardiolipin synthase
MFIPYLTLHKDFIAMLKAARARGVEVSIITNSEHTNDLGQIPYIAGVGHYRELMGAGIRILEWKGDEALKDLVSSNGCKVAAGEWPGQTVHTKAAIFDDQVLMIGSHNFNERSENYNREIMAVVNDPAVAHAMTGIYEGDTKAEGASKLDCAKGALAAPAQVEEITPEILNTRLKEYETRAKALDQVQQLF